MNKKFINYFCRQKPWFCNLIGMVINYKHRSEEDDINLCHMELPKIDRMGYYPSVWRWKCHNIKRSDLKR